MNLKPYWLIIWQWIKILQNQPMIEFTMNVFINDYIVYCKLGGRDTSCKYNTKIRYDYQTMYCTGYFQEFLNCQIKNDGGEFIGMDIEIKWGNWSQKYSKYVEVKVGGSHILSDFQINYPFTPKTQEYMVYIFPGESVVINYLDFIENVYEFDAANGYLKFWEPLDVGIMIREGYYPENSYLLNNLVFTPTKFGVKQTVEYQVINQNLNNLYPEGNKITFFICAEGCRTCDVNNETNAFGNKYCLSCLSGYYFYEEHGKTCIMAGTQPENYYLNHDNIYKKCHELCKSCTEGADDSSTKCTKCIDNYYRTDVNNPGNCEEALGKKYYVDENNQYHFLEDHEPCPKAYPYYVEFFQQCVDDCITHSDCLECVGITFLFTKDTCIKGTECPSGTKLITSQNYCKDIIQGISIPEISDGWWEFEVLTTKNQFKADIDSAINIALEFTKDKDSETITVFGSNDFDFVFYPISQMDKLQNEMNLPKVNLNECVEILRKVYGIMDDEELYIAQLSENSDSKTATTKVEFDVYDGLGNKLNLTCCDDISITVSSPIQDNVPNLNLEEAQFYSELGVDVFDSTNAIFNDRCTVLESDGKDLSLSNRKDYVYQKVSLCEDGCTFISIDYDNNYVNCDCPPVKEGSELSKLIESNEMVSTLYLLISESNLELFLCNNIMLSTVLWHNVGCVLSSALFWTMIITVIIFLTKGKQSINSNIFPYLNTPPMREIICRNKCSIKDSVNQNTKSLSKGLSLVNISQDPASFQQIKIENSCDEKTESEFSPQEWNEMEYEEAIVEDTRKFFVCLFHLFCEKQVILGTIFNGSIFNPASLRIFTFTFTIMSYLFFTAFFFTENYITKRFESSDTGFFYILKNEINKSVYASLWCLLIGKVINMISSINSKFKTIWREKNDKIKWSLKLNLLWKQMKKQNITIISGFILVSPFFLYFNSIFCGLYKNNTWAWLQSCSITIAFHLVLSGVISIVICLLKGIGLKMKNK